MVNSALSVRLKVKPIAGYLIHTGFWEGPCRAGKREDLEPEAEKRAAAKHFASLSAELDTLDERMQVLEPLRVDYSENFATPPQSIRRIEEELGDIDVFLVMSRRVPGLERFGKPIITLSPGNALADVTAYCRSIGLEAYGAVDMADVREILHALWVKKAVSRTRALVLTAGMSPTFGIHSMIRDLEKLRERFGVEVIKRPFTDVFEYMDAVDEEDARSRAAKLLGASKENTVNSGYFVNDVKYAMAAEAMMTEYGCNAFTTACIELCASRLPQERKFAPCVTHSLFKARGIPSACEEDLNALMAMTVMSYAAGKPAFMGNPFYEEEDLLSLHHSVPALNMKGFATEDLPYKIFPFTAQGFGGKFQVDLAALEDPRVTLGRFNPAGDTLSLKTGVVERSEFRQVYCSPYYYIRMNDARGFLHHLGDFGHHQVLVIGDQIPMMKRIARVLGFNLAIHAPG
jgi:L-fucose isomerase-like protein